MAVTITPDDLRQPIGELSESLFPGSDPDFDALLDGWLEQAQIKVESSTTIDEANHDVAAAAWSYFRAYTHVAQRLAAAPSSVSVDSGGVSKSTASDQRKYFIDLAATKLAEFNGYGLNVTPTSLPAAPAFFGRVKARRCG